MSRRHSRPWIQAHWPRTLDAHAASRQKSAAHLQESPGTSPAEWQQGIQSKLGQAEVYSLVTSTGISTRSGQVGGQVLAWRHRTALGSPVCAFQLARCCTWVLTSGHLSSSLTEQLPIPRPKPEICSNVRTCLHSSPRQAYEGTSCSCRDLRLLTSYVVASKSAGDIVTQHSVTYHVQVETLDSPLREAEHAHIHHVHDPCHVVLGARQWHAQCWSFHRHWASLPAASHCPYQLSAFVRQSLLVVCAAGAAGQPKTPAR